MIKIDRVQFKGDVEVPGLPNPLQSVINGHKYRDKAVHVMMLGDFLVVHVEGEERAKLVPRDRVQEATVSWGSVEELLTEPSAKKR